MLCRGPSSCPLRWNLLFLAPYITGRLSAFQGPVEHLAWKIGDNLPEGPYYIEAYPDSNPDASALSQLVNIVATK